MFKFNSSVYSLSPSLFRFLQEQNKKAKSWENGKNSETNDGDMEQEKVNGKAIISDSVPRKYNKDLEMSMNSFLKASPFLAAGGEEEELMMIKSQPKSLDKDWHSEDEFSKTKSKVPHSACELFEERFGKWQNLAFSQAANSGLDTMAEDIYTTRKHDKAAAIAAALSKRELAGKFEELSQDMGGKGRKMAKSPSILCSTAPQPRRNSNREMFLIRSEDLPFMSSRKQEAKINVRMDFLGDSLRG